MPVINGTTYYTMGGGVAVSGDATARGATGALTTPAGAALAAYDLLGNPTTIVTSPLFGTFSSFLTTVPRAMLSFGSTVWLPIVCVEAFDGAIDAVELIPTDDEIQQQVAPALFANAGQHVGIEVDVDDGNSLPILRVTGGGGDPEVIRDVVAATLRAGAGITITVDDAANTITISATGGGGGTEPDTYSDVY